MCVCAWVYVYVCFLKKTAVIIIFLIFFFSITFIEELVKEYVMKNDISTPCKYDRPGRTWMKAFMKRNKLSLKKASMICISRKSANTANTANPFVIYDFYNKLATIFNANPDLNPENIWNYDESRFPTDPGKSKVIALRNKPGFKLSYGAPRENITTLAVCNST